MEVTQPFTVGDIALAAGEILDVASIDEDHLKAARVEDFEDGNPIDAGGFHRHMGDPARRQPIGEAMEITGKCRKGLHRRGVAIGRHRDKVFGCAAVDAGGVRVKPFEGGGRVTRLRDAATGLVWHGGLLLH